MSKMTILGVSGDRDGVLDALMRMGKAEIIHDRPAAGESGRRSGAEFVDSANVRSRLKRMIDGLMARFPETRQLSKKKIRIQEDDFNFSDEEEKELRSQIDRYEALVSERENRQAAVRTLEQQLEQLAIWRGIPVDLSISGTEKTSFIYGIFRDAASLQAFENALEKDYPLTALYLLNDPSELPCRVAIVTANEELSRVRARLASCDYRDLPGLPFSGTAEETVAFLEKKICEENDAMAEVDAKMAEINAQCARLMTYHDYLLVRHERALAKDQFHESPYTFHLNVWVPSGEAESIGRELASRFDIAYDIRPAEKGEETPVKLRNNRFFRAYEVILEMYGAPSSMESDPVPAMAPFYMMLFGMMLSDVGYGGLLVAGTAWMLFKKKIEGEMRRLCAMLFVSGISSVVWGFIFGGFFGDLVTAVTQGRVDFPALWFNPMDSPIKLLLFSMFFGVVHLFFGLAVHIRNERMAGNLIGGLADTVPWYLIIPGLGLLLGAGSAVSDPGTVALPKEIGKWLVIVGAAFALIFSGHGIKNPIKRFFKGLASLYGVTSWLSDILSYSRILALVLATSVIAKVVNMLGMLFGPSVLGYLIFAVIGLFGHGLNLALSALSAFVHTSRLQYVEMFGKFFVGGGSFWNPLRRNTDYVTISGGSADGKAPSAKKKSETPLS